MLTRFRSPQLRILLKRVGHLRLANAHASSGNKSSGPTKKEGGGGDKDKGDKGKKNGQNGPEPCGTGQTKKPPSGPPDCEPVKEPECEPPKEPECEPPKESAQDCVPPKDAAQDCAKEPDCEPQKKPDCEPQKKPDCEPQKKPDCEPPKKPDCEPQKKPDCEPQKKPDCEPPKKPNGKDCKKAAPDSTAAGHIVAFDKQAESEASKSSRRRIPPGMAHPPGMPDLYDDWDFINYPRITMLQSSPPTRFAFIPKAWFDAFYKKTGVSGGYMLFFGCGTFLLSKEFLVIVPEFYTGMTFIGAVAYLHLKFKDMIKNFFDKELNQFLEDARGVQSAEIDSYRSTVEGTEKAVWQFGETVSFLAEAKRENVHLQREAAHRSYLSEVHMNVKEILDYHVARNAVKRRFQANNLQDYVTKSVTPSVTPEMKAAILKDSIENLKNLTPTA